VISRILDMPVIDLLLILLALRFLFPSVFTIKRSANRPPSNTAASFNPQAKKKRHTQRYGENEGEYIEYEEIK
jgi:hypothetical protein